jgi:hypothetical protein
MPQADALDCCATQEALASRVLTKPCLAMIFVTDYYQCAIMRMIVERSPHKNKIDSLWLSKSFQRVGVKDQIKCDLSLSHIHNRSKVLEHLHIQGFFFIFSIFYIIE